eukprot:TRINITY_DN1042_c0_g1_i1.p1 TRINITY_DN1042_c0_g1~~TRINITY_DN1042_c0_g1_i1.p1  ORF type:complete len:925 (+),score=245.33 TRINITY_DN1042_c0_g1_i1:94-2775(+)
MAAADAAPRGGGAAGPALAGPRAPSQPHRPLLNPSVKWKDKHGTDFATIDWVYDMEDVAQRNMHHDRRESMDATVTESRLPAFAVPIVRWMFRVWRALQGWVAVLVIGIITGIVASMIHIGVDFFTDLKEGMCRDYFWLTKKACCPADPERHSCTAWMTWGERFIGDGVESSAGVLEFVTYTLFAVSFTTLSAWLVKTFAPYAAGSGIPEIKTILSGIHIRKYLGAWTLLIKCVGLCLSIGAGLSCGKEGPFVHVASCIGNLVAQLFESYKAHESKRRELISASAAAGVSVAFGAPIGGVLFSLEEASYFFPHKVMWRSFFCAVAAALVMKSINPSHTGRLVLFQVDYNHPWHWFELIPHALLGAVGGVVGAFFNAMNIRWTTVRKRTSLRHWPVTEAACVALFTAIVNYSHPYMRGGATEFLAALFQDCAADNMEGVVCDTASGAVGLRLLLAAGLKLLLTIFTFGMRVPAGLFIPSLFVGACLGRVMGMWVKSLHANNTGAYAFSECQGIPDAFCVIPGIYAIVGAAAVLGGVTRMTLSLVVIMFELTGGLEYLVPVMLAVLISKWVGEWVGTPDSIYEMHIELNGYPYLDPKREAHFQASAADFMVSKNIQVITVDGWTVRDLNELLDGCGLKGFPVVMSHSDLRIVGFISRKNLIAALERAARDPEGRVTQGTEVIFYDRNAEAGPRVDAHSDAGSPPQGPVARNPSSILAPADSGTGGPGPTSAITGDGTWVDITWYLDPTPICVSPFTTANRLLHLFKSLGLRILLVARNNKLVGITTKKDLLRGLNTLQRERQGGPHGAPGSANPFARRGLAGGAVRRRAPPGRPGAASPGPRGGWGERLSPGAEMLEEDALGGDESPRRSGHTTVGVSRGPGARDGSGSRGGPVA